MYKLRGPITVVDKCINYHVRSITLVTKIIGQERVNKRKESPRINNTVASVCQLKL